jgi:hypothetical protein
MNGVAMAFEVTVALVGDRNAPPPGAISPADFKTPWENREKVTLHVDEHESLHAVLTRAAGELDCPPFDSLIPEDSTLVEPFFFVAWHDDNERVPLEARMDFELTLVDENGEAVWAITEKRDIPYRQIVASATAGVLDGDPFKLYLIRRYPQAGGVSADWELLVQALEAGWRVVEGLGASYGAYEAWRRVRERLAGRDALARRMPRWAQRNARTEHLREILGGKPWKPRELATVLGCTTGEAEQILGVFGYTAGEDEHWQYAAGDPSRNEPAADEVSRLLAGYLHEVVWRFANEEVDYQKLEEIFAPFLQRLIDTGHAGAFPSEDEAAALRSVPPERD